MSNELDSLKLSNEVADRLGNEVPFVTPKSTGERGVNIHVIVLETLRVLEENNFIELEFPDA